MTERMAFYNGLRKFFERDAIAERVNSNERGRVAWWRSLGPTIITACVVLGPGSLVVSANIGAKHRYELVWLFVLTGILMAGYVIMAMRVGTIGGASPCTLVAQRLGRPVASIIGVNLFLICSTFQFGNNLAAVAAVRTLFPTVKPWMVLIGLNGLIVCFLFLARSIYHVLERLMKVMVGIILISFLFNLVKVVPDWGNILEGLVPNWPSGLSLELPSRVDGSIVDPLLLVASLLGTTFSVGAAFYQGNLVREKGWDSRDCARGAADAVVGIAVLTFVSAMIMITTATVIPGESADNIGSLALTLEPALGKTAHLVFCVGLLAIALNPFMINAMIGGSILADGLGLPARMREKWPRRFTVLVLLMGMIVAMVAIRSGERPVNLIIFGQSLTVLGNPLMAATILWLANRKDVMGSRRNKIVLNLLGSAGLLIVILVAFRVFYRLIL